MLHDSMLGMGMFAQHDMMPMFNMTSHTDTQHFERLFLNDSPPESPSYSTSDASSEEFVDFVQSPKEFHHDTMWGSHGHTDMFLASSVSWVPEVTEGDNEFASLVHFAQDDTVVAIDELSEPKPALMLPEVAMLPEVEEDVKPNMAMLNKRKASIDSLDERPMKKSKSFSRSSSPSPSSSQDMSRSDDPEAKRLTHNVLERRRRNDLKNSYQQLRVMIPTLEDNERAPTGQILIHAVDHITALKGEEQCLLAELAAARAENDRLRAMYGMN